MIALAVLGAILALYGIGRLARMVFSASLAVVASIVALEVVWLVLS